MPRLFSIAAALCCVAMTLPPAAAANPARAWLDRQGYAPPTSREIVACHGYGCSRRTAIPVHSDWLRRAAAILDAGRMSARAERDALRAVVRIYTSALASAFGGRRDVPRSPPSLSGTQGQMDCLDTTANTISLLLVLEEAGAFSHHQIAPPQSRGIFLDGRYPHFTAAIREKAGGQLWAVDPWTRAPGQEPEILPLQQWQEAS
jgi:hypothetical protein